MTTNALVTSVTTREPEIKEQYYQSYLGFSNKMEYCADPNKPNPASHSTRIPDICLSALTSKILSIPPKRVLGWEHSMYLSDLHLPYILSYHVTGITKLISNV
jgi:hypothetical protein